MIALLGFIVANPALVAAGEPAARTFDLATEAAFTPGRGHGYDLHSAPNPEGRPYFFSVAVPEGNYRVTVTFGGERASATTVKAESRRLLLESIRTAPDDVVNRTFLVNVRNAAVPPPEKNAPGGSAVVLNDRELGSLTWDDKLTLEFNGPAPAPRTVAIEPANVPTVFLLGDSTVTDQRWEDGASWGQMLPRFFKPGISVANYAQSGESIKSSLSARRFEKIFSLMKPGDWLLVQFGHNDMKDRAPDALATYRKHLKSIVTQTKEKGGTPVLITSMERKAGVNAPTLGGYPDAVRGVAREEDVALIDLHAMSVQLYQTLGTNLSRAFQDGTHHNNYGSYELARCVTAGIAAAKLDLGGFLVNEVKAFDPTLPDPVETFTVPPSPMRSAAKPDGN